MRSIFVNDYPDGVSRIFTEDVCAVLKQAAGLEDTVYTGEAIRANPGAFRNVTCIFSTWGMVSFTEEEIEVIFPALQCVFYGAGSVQHFARPFLNRGIKVFSAWVANAVPVAEYTVAQILLANKGFFYTSRPYSVGDKETAYTIRKNTLGNYGVTVGLIGVGQISRLVIRLLKNFNLKVKVCSRSLTAEGAAELGVERCSLEEIFSTCQVVSNHLANNPSTVGTLREAHFASMVPYATFLNTGRGAQVVEADLAKVLAQRPDLTAVLDVTWPEPPLPDNPFFGLPNCILTPHIAGSTGNEVQRMGKYMQEEFLAFAAGEPTRYEVTLKMLETMA